MWTLKMGILFLMLPLSTLGLSITGPGQAATKQASYLKVLWLNNLTMELRLPDNTTDTIRLIPSSNIANTTTPCLFSGKLENDKRSVVAVAGCKDSQETSISIASRRVPGGLVDLSIVNEITYIIEDDVTIDMPRYKRDAGLEISKDDFVIPPPPIQNLDLGAALLKPSANSPLPYAVILETSVKYDNSLLQQFAGSHTATKQWINRVVELAKPRLSHQSLNVAIQLYVVGDMEHQDEVIKADKPTINRLGRTSKQKSLVSYFSADICPVGGCIVGIAFIGAACRKDGFGININEYYSNSNSEIRTARIFVHELGHNIGMRHDFDDKHGGDNGPCNGKGLMSYGDTPDVWSQCSNADFETWYRNQGFTCLKPKPKCYNDSPLVFDPQFYLATYNDLRCAFIKPGIDTFTAAAQHWCDYGVKEGRQGIASFNSKAYLARYDDLQKAFGKDNIVRATTHFIEFGFKEGRNGSSKVALTTQVSPCSIYTQPIYHFSGWKPKCDSDSPHVFDPRFYLATYNDLRSAFIKPRIETFDAAAQHWCDYGVKEGRQGIA